jgi:hypothetical protein
LVASGRGAFKTAPVQDFRPLQKPLQYLPDMPGPARGPFSASYHFCLIRHNLPEFSLSVPIIFNITALLKTLKPQLNMQEWRELGPYHSTAYSCINYAIRSQPTYRLKSFLFYTLTKKLTPNRCNRIGEMKFF